MKYNKKKLRLISITTDLKNVNLTFKEEYELLKEKNEIETWLNIWMEGFITCRENPDFDGIYGSLHKKD